jgi:glycine/D-amino acid oxidase-like deaminating enzyme
VQAEEHTGSYYAATVGDVTDYPPLAGEQRADVCVVGAGFTGLSTALFLAERGYDVRIVEANRIGWGASGRNGGQVISGISGEAAVAKHWGRDVEELFGELRWAGHAIIRERIDTYGIDCDFKYGYLDVAIKPRHLRDLEADQARLAAANFPHEVRLVSRDETRELTGTDKYLGGLVNMGNGHLHPLKLCVGEARAAVQNGARFHERSPVLAIEEGSRPRVVTAGGAVTADAVVIAGNAYHDLHPRLRGILFPVRSYIIATEPLSPEVVASINPRDLAVCDPNFVLQYFRLSVDKRLLFGARFNYLGADPAVIERHHRRALAKLWPRLAGVRIDYAWGGNIGVPVNRVPQFGRLSPNVYYCQGYSGHGVNVTHLAGQILADAIAGTLERFDLFASVKPVRVPFGHALRKPMVSLGVLYYQLKDRL